jgi:hypothetical protein
MFKLPKLFHLIKEQMIICSVFSIIIFIFYDDYSFINKKPDLWTKIVNVFHFSIVTQFAVGYGDVYPHTNFGKLINIPHILIAYYLLAKDIILKNIL